MSLVIEVEAPGKAGRVCDRSYRRGTNCPLILRQTSEDVMTATVFGVLKNLSPKLWLVPMLEAAFPASQFHPREMRDLTVHFWPRLPAPGPRAKTEGQTEVDVLIQFDKTCVFIEIKLGAGLATRTARDPNRDQISRLIDVALWHTKEQLFAREALVLLIGVADTPPGLLRERRRPSRHGANALEERASIPQIGYVGWNSLTHLLLVSMATASIVEQRFLVDVVRYVQKRTQRQRNATQEPLMATR